MCYVTTGDESGSKVLDLVAVESCGSKVPDGAQRVQVPRWYVRKYLSPHCPFPSFFENFQPSVARLRRPFDCPSSYVRLLLTKPSQKLYLWYIKSRKESSMDTGVTVTLGRVIEILLEFDVSIAVQLRTGEELSFYADSSRVPKYCVSHRILTI